MTNLDIAALAQEIQDNSGDNVNVEVTFNLGDFSHQWQVNIYLLNLGKIVRYVAINPLSKSAHSRLRMMAKHGYNTAKAAY